MSGHRYFQLPAAIVLLVGLIATTPAGAHSVEEQLGEIGAEWLEAFERKDIAAIEDMYASDGLFLVPGRPPVEGPEAIGEIWRSWSELPNVAIDFGAVRTEVSGAGDMAYEYGTYTFAFDGEEGRVSEEGKYVVVWKKVDGAWKVAADIFNANAAE